MDRLSGLVGDFGYHQRTSRIIEKIIIIPLSEMQFIMLLFLKNSLWALQLTWAESEAICAQILEGGLRALRLWQWARFSRVLLVTWNLLMERQCFPSIVFWRVKSKNDTFFFQVVKLCVSSAHSHTLTSTTKQILNFPGAMSAEG